MNCSRKKGKMKKKRIKFRKDRADLKALQKAIPTGFDPISIGIQAELFRMRHPKLKKFKL